MLTTSPFPPPANNHAFALATADHDGDATDRESHAYAVVAAAIAWLAERAPENPSLDALAARLGYSPAHAQRLFTRWAGVSPKKFLQAAAARAARRRLAAGAPVLESALAAGLSGPGRLHDLLVNLDGLTPGEVGRQGEGVTLGQGWAETPFGDALLAWSPRGLCFLAFAQGTREDDRPAVEDDLRERWPGARLERPDVRAAAGWSARIFHSGVAAGEPLPVWLRGTQFQVRVWEALLRVPPGATTTYGALARAVGRPGGARAVGGAVGSNPISWLIPCHRVLRGDGALGGYRWGTPRKEAMLLWEELRAG